MQQAMSITQTKSRALRGFCFVAHKRPISPHLALSHSASPQTL
ncbi:hypothetical protein PSEUDO8BK_40235 [Pseudomonas sp. 8BK]|nr:hypothetical protein PSEUDO8BK_40235 [Pseudomonas sp. 8BK]